MGNKFKEFLSFIYETTGHIPDFGESFEDLFIYIPKDKTIPEARMNTCSSVRSCTVSLQNYFANRNKDFAKLVYNADWELLENYLGPRLLRFCLTECIFAKRTKAGAFMVSKLSNLQNKLTVRPPKKLPKIFYNTSTYEKEDDANLVKDNTELSNNNNPQKNLNHSFHELDLEVTTDNILFKISRSPKFPDSHVLVKTNNEVTMSSQVVNTRIGISRVIEHEDCVEPLEVILKKFKKSHTKYNYEKALNKLLTPHVEATSNELSGQPGLANELSLVVLKKFFTNIFNRVIPRELFGNNRNINIVIKSICELLEAPQHQSVSLKPYLSKMKITDIHWLDNIKNPDAQWTMLVKMLKWLYNKYILEIFRTQLYIIVTNSTKKIYFKQSDWQKLSNEFLRKMCKDEVISRMNGLTTKVSCDGRWILFPKKNGMRPIMSRLKGNQPGESAKMALRYLQQLYITKYGPSGKEIFLEKWRDLAEKVQKSENITMYLVCCDIQYAYGSIDQKKLLSIVENLAKSTGPELSLKWYRIARNLNAVKSNCSKLKQCYVYPELELPVPTKSVFACSSEKIAKVRKEVLFREIKKNVLKQNLLVLNQWYLLQKGIAQGAILSSVLCDMYYAHMEETSLSEFKNKGLLYRYVDDFLFATEDKALAERFLQIVANGIPEYNCSFNAAKTRTNLPGHKHTAKYITFLGYNFDPATLEATLDYAKSPRYTTFLSKPRYKVIKTFRSRLSNVSSLKLNGIVLDCKINSTETILDNIKHAFMRQAERCLWLLKALIEDIPSHIDEIYRIIKSTNLQIIRYVQRYFSENGYEFDKQAPLLAVIPWSSYRQIFGKMPNIHVHFRSLFLENIKKAEHASARK